MRLTVVIPVHGATAELVDCLAALTESTERPDEVIVVDDGSPEWAGEQIAAAAERAGARCLRQARQGPAAARNRGARASAGELLMFVDADVRVWPCALERVKGAFGADASLAGVFGSYDNRPAAGTLVSDYRNLLHHWVHQTARRRATTFWAGCGAIRREIFLGAGGFDMTFERPSIEDVELGLRLSAAGHRLELHREIQATHTKRWTLRTFFLTDLTQRAIPWTRLLLRRGWALPRDLNFGFAQRGSVALTMLLPVTLAGSAFNPLMGGALTVLVVLLIAGLNFAFLSFLARLRGPAFALAAVPLHVVHYFASALGLLAALIRRR